MTEIILHLSSGQGPKECEWVVSQLVRVWAREAEAAGLTCEPIEPVSGPAATVLLRVAGVDAAAFVAEHTGTIRWIGTSPFRPLHKRKNWFVGCSPAPLEGDVPEFRDEDIRYQTLRASGPGGQHVNKTDSAVRGAGHAFADRPDRLLAGTTIAIRQPEDRPSEAGDAVRRASGAG